MSLKFHNKIIILSNRELIDLLKRNNFDFEDVLTKQRITGTQFLKLIEFDLIRWGLSISERRTLMRCVTELNNNPQKFFSQAPTSKLEKMTIARTFKNPEFNKQLEFVISGKPTDLSFNKTKLSPKNSPIEPFVPEYITMDRSLPPIDDENDYLCPIEVQKAEEPVYEDSPSNDSRTSEILEKKPLTLPRPYTDDRGYILGPANPKIEETEETYEEIEEAKNAFEKSVQHPNNNNNKKKLDQFSVPTKKKVENSLQFRPLPQIPQISYTSQDEESGSGEGIYTNDDINPGKFRVLCETPPNINKSHSSTSLASQRSGGSCEKLDSCNYQNSGRGYDDFTNKQFKKLPLPPDTLPKAPLHLPEGFFQANNQGPESENIYDEPYFRNTDRKGAKLLLHDLPDGAFLLRKSNTYYVVLTVKYKTKFINLRIEKLRTGMLRLCGDDDSSPDFTRLGQLLDYFTVNPIGFALESGEIGETVLKKVLPSSRF